MLSGVETIRVHALNDPARQISLDELVPRARTTDPAASQNAAKIAGRGAVRAVLEVLAYGPAHADAICEAIDTEGRQWQTFKSALSRATRAGLVTPTGETQLSLLGSGQRVHRLTAAGRAALDGTMTDTRPL